MIKCEVIKDLLPLYIDDALSKVSREVVEEHISICNECKGYCEKLTKIDIPVVKNNAADEKQVIKTIRRKLNKKRMIAVCITAILLVAIAIGVLYPLFFKESYLTYEEAGLYVEDGILRTDESYYSTYLYDSPEEGVLFIYMTTTVYERNREQDESIIVWDLDSEYAYMEAYSKLAGREQVEGQSVYYIPQEYIELLEEGYWVDAEDEEEYKAKNQDKLEALKEDSILVWERE